MSLIVSVRVLDGVVIAGDTLTSVTTKPKQTPKGQPLVAASFPASHSASKVFPFLDSFGVGVVGNPIIAGKSVGSMIRTLETELGQGKKGSHTVQGVAEKISARIRKEVGTGKESVHLICCGFDDADAQPCTVEVGVQRGNITFAPTGPAVGLGATAKGAGDVAQALWNLATARKTEWGFNFFSLRDAIEYAKFLIGATADYQRFSLEPQTVGGGIDVGLVERGQGFRWIQSASRVGAEK